MENPRRFIVRLYQPTDFNAVLGAVQAAELADALPLCTSAEYLRARLRPTPRDARLNPADDQWVAVLREAGVVAFADGWLVGASAERSYRTACYVHPDYRARGIGRALLTRQCQRAKAIARRLSTAGAPVTVTLGARALEQQASALAVFAAVGLPRVRTHLQMRRELADLLPAVRLPLGLRLDSWLDPRTDEAVWQAHDEAFSGHWGHITEPFEDFIRRMALGHVRREHSFVAWAGGQVAGACLNDVSEAARAVDEPAWINNLFVRRAWRRRGLGRALVAASLERAKQLGYTRTSLNVDAENPTGAVRLYEAAGFQLVTRRFIYQRAFSAVADEGRRADSERR